MMRKIKRLLAVMLTVCLLAEPLIFKALTDEGQGFVKVYAAEDGKAAKAENFVSDLRLYKTSDLASAKKQAAQEGYTLFSSGETPVDLNEYTGKDYITLGYKTSKDEKDAVRDVKMLEMGNGYEWYDYIKVIEGQTEKLEPQAADIVIAANEMKAKLKEGSRAASMAKDYLNFLYFTKDIETYLESYNKDTLKADIPKGGYRCELGDWLVSEDINRDVIKKILIMANGGSLTALYSQLAIGVSDTGETWAERIGKSDVYQELNAQTIKTSALEAYDKMYYGYSNELLPKLQEFAKAYRAAEARRNRNNGEIETPDLPKGDLNAENAKDVAEASKDAETGDLMYIAAYETMNQFTVGKLGAGDYLLSLAEAEYEAREDMRRLYPFVEALTNGQYAMMKIVGVPQIALALDHSDDVFAEMERKKADALDAVKKASGGDSAVCVWAGVNTEFYERKVALTSKAYRESNASKVYEDLTRMGTFYEDMHFAMTIIGLAGSVSMLITSSITIALAGTGVTVWAACASAVGAGIMATIGGVIGCLAVIVGYACLAAMIVVAVIYLIHWLIHRNDDADKEDYLKMPDEIYDWREDVVVNGKRGNSFVKYDVLRNSKGDAQDINADDGKRWNLLYLSRDERFGSPLCLNELGKVFARTVGKATTPEGYEPVTLFGGKDAANLNSYVRKKGAKSIYLHFVTKDQVEHTIYRDDIAADDANYTPAANVNKGTKVKLEKGEQYLNGLMISNAKSEREAKSFINKNPGFRVLDQNLTPGNGYTYLGYSSTNVADGAITDIRIVPSYNGSENVTFGAASYGCAGILPDGAGLMYTRFKEAGSAVIDSISFTSEPLSKEKPLEPVCTFYTTQPYSFTQNKSDEIRDFEGQYFDTEEEPLYMYFKPSVSFTSGDEYISGLQFVTDYQPTQYECRLDEGSKPKKRDVKDIRTAVDYLNDNGLEYFDVDFAAGEEIIEKINYLDVNTRRQHTDKYKINWFTSYYKARETYLAYTTTYNPYRAVYDVAVYTATPRLKTLPHSITGTKGSYAAAYTTLITNETFVTAEDAGDYIDLVNLNSYMAKEVQREIIHTVSTRAYNDKLLDSEALRNYYGLLDKHRWSTVEEKVKKAGTSPVYYHDDYNTPELNLQYFVNRSNPEGNMSYDFGKLRLQGLYQLGPVQGMAPLKRDDIVVTYGGETPDGMHSVHRFSDPYQEEPVDLGICDNAEKDVGCYIYLSGEEQKKGKYISGFDVVSYERPPDPEKRKLSKDELFTYAQTCDDTCMLGLISRLEGEILNCNFAVDQKKAWYNDSETEVTEASYLSVSRTDDVNCAITGAMMYKAGDKQPPARIKVNGVEYRRTGKKAGTYYFYYTKNPGANPGVPVENLSFSDIPIVNGESTVVCVTGAEADGNAQYTDDFKGWNGYFHLSAPTENVIITDGMKLFEGDKASAGINAMKEGYHNMVDESLNYGTNEKGAYLFFRMCSEKILECDEGTFEDAHEDFMENWDGEEDDFGFDEEFWEDFDFDFDVESIEDDITVRDIICVRSDGTYPGDTYQYSGRTYKAVQGKLPVNKGSYGDSIWIYYTTERVDGLSPIRELCLCSGDSVPFYDLFYARFGVWEKLLDTRLNEVNLNEGVIGTDKNDATLGTDCRLYMFINRYKSDVKKNANIHRGVMLDQFKTVELFWEP